MSGRLRSILLPAVLWAAALPLAAASPLPDFTDLVEENSPAVVSIEAHVAPPQIARRHEIPKDHPLFHFFEKFFKDPPPGRSPWSAPRGSGFLVSADGYILTNRHVVGDSEKIVVRLQDRREFRAELIGTDEHSDLAVLHIDAENLPAVTVGDSSRLRVGEWVMAIGSPFGFDYSVTVGVVSAIGRGLPNENYVPYIQTDVAINPGNSGGPLFTLSGDVVGVNAQIFSPTGGYSGLSFTIPINLAMEVYRQIREHGRVTRGWLGVRIQDVTHELAASFQMDQARGALIAQVLPASPAMRAGLREGDVIVRFGDREIIYASDLPPRVGSTAIGSEVALELIRDGRSKSLRVTVGELPGDAEDRPLADVAPPVAPLGLEVSDPTEEERQELALGDHGVVVRKVMPGPALAAGIRVGDALLQFDNREIEGSRHFRALAAKLAAGKPVPILLQRDGAPLFLALRRDPLPEGLP